MAVYACILRKDPVAIAFVNITAAVMEQFSRAQRVSVALKSLYSGQTPKLDPQRPEAKHTPFVFYC